MGVPVLLTLDLASSTGWSYGPAGGRPRRGTWDLGRKPKTPRPVRLLALRGYLTDFLAMNTDITEVAYEAPMSARVMAEIGSTIETAMLLLGLCNEAETVCYEAGVDCSMHDVQDVRAHFTGRRRYKDTYDPIAGRTIKSRDVAKAATLARCKLLGIPCDDDNQADAVALHDYLSALRRPSTAHERTPLFRGVAA